MPNKNAIILQKMLRYCDDAVKYSVGCGYDEFIQNELFLTFSVFSLSQLGELSVQLDRDFVAKYPEIPWQALRGLRNRIVHNYDGVKHTILWDVMTKDIPALKQQLFTAAKET